MVQSLSSGCGICLVTQAVGPKSLRQWVCNRHALFVWKYDKRQVCMKPRTPPTKNKVALLDGTATAFRQVHASEWPFACIFKKETSLGVRNLEVSWCHHRLAQTPKEAFSGVRVHAGTTQVDFEVDRRHLQILHPGDHLITMVKETVRKSFEKWKRKVSWCDQTRVDLHLHRSTCLVSRILTQKEPFPRSEFMLVLQLDILDVDRSPSANSPPRDRLITMIKLKKKWSKMVSENEKNPKRPRRSVRKIDEYFIVHAYEDGCVKVANMKSVRKCLPGGCCLHVLVYCARWQLTRGAKCMKPASLQWQMQAPKLLSDTTICNHFQNIKVNISWGQSRAETIILITRILLVNGVIG